MKKILFAGFMLAGMHSFAQKVDATQVPASVKSNFSKTFPDVAGVKWEIEKRNYEANFKQGGAKMAALYDDNGKWLETETGMAVSALPAGVTDYVAKNYKGEKIKEASKIQLANGETNYEAAIKGTDLIFDAGGKFIRAVKD